MNTTFFIAKFVVAGIVWFYLFNMDFGEKKILQHIAELKQKSETVTAIEAKVNFRIQKIKEKLGASTKPPPSPQQKNF